jgi:hypothetical protein
METARVAVVAVATGHDPGAAGALVAIREVPDHRQRHADVRERLPDAARVALPPGVLLGRKVLLAAACKRCNGNVRQSRIINSSPRGAAVS